MRPGCGYVRSLLVLLFSNVKSGLYSAWQLCSHWGLTGYLFKGSLNILLLIPTKQDGLKRHVRGVIIAVVSIITVHFNFTLNSCFYLNAINIFIKIVSEKNYDKSTRGDPSSYQRTQTSPAVENREVGKTRK